MRLNVCGEFYFLRKHFCVIIIKEAVLFTTPILPLPQKSALF